MADNRYNDYYDREPGDPYHEKSSMPYWIVSLVLLFTIPPVGVLMLALRLFGGSRRQYRGRHPYYAQQGGGASMGAQTEQAPGATHTHETTKASHTHKDQKQEWKQQKAWYAHRNKLFSRGKTLTLIGGIFAAVFGFASIMAFVDNLYFLPDITFLLEDMVPLLCFFAGGVGMLWTGLRQRKEARRFRKYLSLIGRHTSISISSLASAMPASMSQVCRDLEDMLDEGWFPAGYLDYGGDMLVLSPDGLTDAQPQQAQKEETKQAEPAADGGENAILAEIRAVNDAISNVNLSAQIDRIGIITAKIFDYQKSHPEKSPQLHSFLSYYLPTTLKILRAYAQLESQGVEGSNINAAMSRIEGMMNKVVEGFEKQLDQLFQGDALDITTDVAVLEQMLSKDGLSSGGFQLEL